MSQSYLKWQQLKKVNPYDGLMIDALAWADAHSYHQSQQRLHALALHQSGIVSGLEVTANDPPDLSVIIHPGLGIDPEGNVILVTQQQRYYLQPKDRGLVYISIEFREIAAERSVHDGDQPTRILEAYRIQQRESLPEGPYLELARVRVENPGKGIRDPEDPWMPSAEEIDGRFRVQTTLRPQGELAVGLLVPRAGVAAPQAPHRGLRNLARQLSLEAGYRVVQKGMVQLGGEASNCALLYMPGSQPFSFDQYEMAALSSFLEAGGVLMGDLCSERSGSQSSGFEIGFKVIAERLGSHLTPVTRDHPLMGARYPFAVLPGGAADGGELLEGGGVIYSGLDVGCAWAGGHEAAPLARAALRDALEFGVNVAAFAESRCRRASLRKSSV